MAIRDLKENLKRLKDADPVELAGQVNSWLQESGEAIRLRVEDEVEKAVTKRGFVKRSEFLKLEARIASLEGAKNAKKDSKEIKEDKTTTKSKKKNFRTVKKGKNKVAVKNSKKGK